MAVSIADLDIKLKNARNNRRLSQIDAAKMIGVSNKTLSSYENGDNTPSAEVLISMADVYNISIDYLLGIDKERVIRTNGLKGFQIDALDAMADTLKKSNTEDLSCNK